MRIIKTFLLTWLIVMLLSLGAVPAGGKTAAAPSTTSSREADSPSSTRLVVFEGFLRFG